MDKNLLKAYIRTVVEEEVNRVLPKLLDEAITQVKQLNESNGSQAVAPTQEPKIDRTSLARLMNLSYDGETLSAGITPSHAQPIPEEQVNYGEIPGVHGTLQPVDIRRADPKTVKEITKDYSDVMKRLNLT